MLRTVNVDNNTVGWYQSAYMGSFFDSSLIDAQHSVPAPGALLGGARLRPVADSRRGRLTHAAPSA